MSDSSRSRALPEYLFNAWIRQSRGELQHEELRVFSGWSMTDFAKELLRYQLGIDDPGQEKIDLEHRNAASDVDYQEGGGSDTQVTDSPTTKSLYLLALMKLSDSTGSPFDVRRQIRRTSDTSPENIGAVLEAIVTNLCLPYPQFRVLRNMPEMHCINGRAFVDVDEAILKNEFFIRSRGFANQDRKYLVTLEELCTILTEATLTRRVENFLDFKRRDPPKGGLEILDDLRQKEVRIHLSDTAFTRTFHRITKNVLYGLDWSNIIVGGGMVLTTLLHTDPAKDDELPIRDPDLDCYIYGLGPAEANEKVQEIYNTWIRNLPSVSQQKLIIKTAKTIELLSIYPTRRIQIILKTFCSPLDVLLSFDLDACAIGFNGAQVLMLPRCARALETGYSIYTTDLVWGHPLSFRRETRLSRLFKYAGRGFGLRILPCYAQSIQDDSIERGVLAQQKNTTSVFTARTHPGNQCRERKPLGTDELGLKTLKRIAYLGRDFVHRLYYGPTPISRSTLRLGIDVPPALQDALVSPTSSVWPEDRLPIINLRSLGNAREVLDGVRYNVKGIANLEILARQAEAWSLAQRGKAFLIDQKEEDFGYDDGLYWSLPQYKWDERFDLRDYIDDLDQVNYSLLKNLQRLLLEKLQLDAMNLYTLQTYLTRGVSHVVYGTDIKAVLQKHITLPILIPHRLEDLLEKMVAQGKDIPSLFADFKHIVPIHDPHKHDALTSTLPSLESKVDEKPNLRYWNIDQNTMWSKQNQTTDELFEILWSLFYWLNSQCDWPQPCQWRIPSASELSTSQHTDNDLAKTHEFLLSGFRLIARSYRRRLVLGNLPDRCQDNSDRGLAEFLSLRERFLFRNWAFETPVISPKGFFDPRSRLDAIQARSEMLAIRYPFPDQLFWHAGDEGSWHEDGVPDWLDSESDTETQASD